MVSVRKIVSTSAITMLLGIAALVSSPFFNSNCRAS